MLTGWIIYNGSLKIGKISQLVGRLQKVAKARGIDLIGLKNNQIMPSINQQGQIEIKTLTGHGLPDFVIFWDKDILLAKYLERLGLRLFNSAEAIGLCDDKAKIHIRLSQKGIPMPKTIIGPLAFFKQDLSGDYLEKVQAQLGFPLVLKENAGSFGMQVYKIDGPAALRQKIEDLKHQPFILQEWIKTTNGRDIRVNIIGDKIMGAILRENPQDFRANISLGGRARAIVLAPDQADLALKAHCEIGLDFSGVDLLFGDRGQMLLCEVNSNVNFLSFEAATGLDFAGRLIDYVIREIG